MLHANRRSLVLSLSLLFGAPLSFGATVPGQNAQFRRNQDEARASLAEVVKEYQRVFNSRDASALSAFYAEDADMIIGNTPNVQGRDAIAAWWRNYFDRQEPERRARFGVKSSRLVADGAALVNVSSWTGGRDQQGGELQVRRARGTWLLVRSGSSWLISALRGLPSEQDQVILTPAVDAAGVRETAVPDSPTRIQAFVKTYEKAFNARDPSALVALYERDADIIVRNEPAVDGRESIEDWWHSYLAESPYLASPDVRIRFAIEEARMITPQVALANILAGPAMDVDQEVPARQARGTWLLVDRGGEWLLAALRVLPSEQDRIIRAGENAAWHPGAPITAEDLVREHVRAWSEHDVQLVDRLFAEGAFYEDVAVGKVYRGRDEIRAFLEENFAAVPDFRIELTRVFSNRDWVACEWIMSGTQTGDYPEIPATGKSFSVRGASVAHLEDGKFKRWTDYYDLFGFLNQLGVDARPGPQDPR